MYFIRPNNADIIQGVAPVKSIKLSKNNERAEVFFSKADNRGQGTLLIGINARDRTGLLLDISKSLLRLDLKLRYLMGDHFQFGDAPAWEIRNLIRNNCRRC